MLVLAGKAFESTKVEPLRKHPNKGRLKDQGLTWLAVTNTLAYCGAASKSFTEDGPRFSHRKRKT